MKYVEYRIEILSSAQSLSDDLCMAVLQQYLADGGFDSFTTEGDSTLLAYCPSSISHTTLVPEVIKKAPLAEVIFSFSFKEMPDINWNEVWEKNFFQAISVADCYIRAPFHSSETEKPLTLLIQPQMAFGTGHHATTASMIYLLSQADLKDMTVTDMGCGSGILGIYALLKGARKVQAIDIDDWCYRNTLENAGLNKVHLEAFQGDAGVLAQMEQADIFLANINRNIILNDIDAYLKAMKPCSQIFLSGFLESDLSMMKEALIEKDLHLKSEKISNGWVALQAIKNE